ncbi:Hypothetical predicted protein [Cloeon dipterum]|uniref:Zinc finger MYND domain-containing protein 11 n=1 Tax=Cloeon dipterum TaxID=197152 RepID=A0A8S1BPX1_9INSE|nr:Hypothetical predicted protein [Cloeon dipterum]
MLRFELGRILYHIEIGTHTFMNMENVGARPIRKVQRKSSTGELHQIWDAISYWTSDSMRQQPTQERIHSFLKARYGITEESVNAMLMRCLDDQLLLRETKQGTRGKLLGKMVEIHTIPTSLQKSDGWDWYCAICHDVGIVTGCVSCHRVYHNDCLPDQYKSDNLKCPTCTEIEDELSSKNHNLENLNKCIGFVCERVKLFVPENLLLRKVPVGLFQKSVSYQDFEVEPYREVLIFYEQMSVGKMARKAQNREYKTLAEFVADANTLFHNVQVFHHGNNQFPAPTLKPMQRTLMHDADELKNCLQCFLYSNEQPENWYCLPCDPPHTLVYAKQKGYCYWPAKVIKKNEEGRKVKYDVRFFGPPYERALIEEAFIKPITTPVSSLSLKRTAKLNSALDELENHMNQLNMSKSTVPVAPKNSVVDNATASPPKKRLKTAKQQEKVPKPAAPKKEVAVAVPVVEQLAEEPAVVDAKEEEEKTEPELPVEADMPPELDANRNSVTSSDSRKVVMEESSEDAVSSSNATNGEVSNANAECLEQLRQKHAVEVAKMQQAHAEEIKKLKEEHRLQAEVMKEQHRVAIEETKAKIWCCQCFGEAILYCCWQTAYCSKECQHRHWMSDHKLKCRRSR